MKYILATSSWCGPCKAVKEFMANEKIDFELKDMEDDFEFFKQHNIKSVPTLVCGNDIYSGSDVIITFLKNNENQNS